ncbi:Uncharacterised protein [Actinomyces bovis]|uniref:Uncharacterized protein n=1 Tax=Actinomyces bovis TaxID=1658 RepID=A0ABY1VQ80_9ACTO|nr:hypothetical protein [Actinomyces bovis]SPT54288.1 Uncharacterised protein [Actinomyces bovis]VEG56377.1 Uncharacterised protein [Actinomyces israelii]
MSTENPSRPEDAPEKYGQIPESAATADSGEQQPIELNETAAAEARLAQTPSAQPVPRVLDAEEPLVLPESMVLPEGVNLEELARSMEIPSLDSDPSAKTVAVTPEMLLAAQGGSAMATQRLDYAAERRQPTFPTEASYSASEQATVNLSERPELVPPMPNPALQPKPLDASLPPVPAPPQWEAAGDQAGQASPVAQPAQAGQARQAGPLESPVAASPNSLSAWSERTAAAEPVAAEEPAETVIGTPPSLAAAAAFGTENLGPAAEAGGAGASATAPGLAPAAIPAVAPAPPAATSPTAPQSGERPTWPGAPAPVPTKPPRSDAEVLLEGSSVVGHPASRAAWHWGGALIAVVLFPLAWYLCHAGKLRLADNLPTPRGNFVPGVDVVGLLELGGGLLALLLALLVARKSASGPFVVGIISLILGAPFLVAPGPTWDFLAPWATRLTDQSTLGANLVRFLIMDGYTGTFVLIGLAMIVVGMVAHSTRRAGRREREIISRAKR